MQRAVVVLGMVAALLLGGSAAASLAAGPPAGPVASASGGPALPFDPLAPVPGGAGSVLSGLLDGLGGAPSPPGVDPGARAVPSPGSDRRPARKRAPAPFVPAAAPAGPAPDPFQGLGGGAFAGYATGTVYHADAGLSGPKEPVDVELGFAGAAYSSTPVGRRIDELRRPVSPALEGGSGFGQGRPVRIGQEAAGDDDDVLGLDDQAEAKAPPSGKPVTKEVTDVNLRPVVDADVLRAEASARAAASGCVIGSDLAYGLGSATKTAMVEASQGAPAFASDAGEPPRGVSQSLSRMRLLPRQPGRFGLVAETRQTIAPITLLKGTDDQFTVEVGGEWMLRATADGRSGSITFGPEGRSDDDRPLLRVLDRKGRVTNELSAQDLVSGNGVVTQISDTAEVAIGEDPRAIGGDGDSKPTATGTRVAGAVDVVRIRLLGGAEDAPVELRVGHMEVAVGVPPDGVACPGIGMTKRSDPANVTPGDHFSWTITVSNPNDCVLENVNIVDTVTADPGLRYRILSSSPAAESGSTSPLRFSLGPLRFGESRTIRIDAAVGDEPIGGRFREEVAATGKCAGAPLEGRVSLAGPTVNAVLAGAAGGRSADSLPRAQPQPQSRPARLARTGGLDGALPALAMLATGTILRRLRRRR